MVVTTAVGDRYLLEALREHGLSLGGEQSGHVILRDEAPTGDGLRIALVTLNVGRLGLPAACVGFTKRCTEIVRRWSTERVQWGKPIGRHEAVAHKIAGIASTAFAIESIQTSPSDLAWAMLPVMAAMSTVANQAAVVGAML